MLTPSAGCDAGLVFPRHPCSRWPPRASATVAPVARSHPPGGRTRVTLLGGGAAHALHIPCPTAPLGSPLRRLNAVQCSCHRWAASISHQGPPCALRAPPVPRSPWAGGPQRARRGAWVPPPPGCSCALSAPSPSARALTARQVAVPLGAVSPSPQPPGVPRARPRGVCPLASAPCSLWSACTGPARAPRRVGAVFTPRGPRWRTDVCRVAGAPVMQ